MYWSTENKYIRKCICNEVKMDYIWGSLLAWFELRWGWFWEGWSRCMLEHVGRWRRVKRFSLKASAGQRSAPTSRKIAFDLHREQEGDALQVLWFETCVASQLCCLSQYDHHWSSLRTRVGTLPTTFWNNMMWEHISSPLHIAMQCIVPLWPPWNC